MLGYYLLWNKSVIYPAPSIDLSDRHSSSKTLVSSIISSLLDSIVPCQEFSSRTATPPLPRPRNPCSPLLKAVLTLSQELLPSSSPDPHPAALLPFQDLVSSKPRPPWKGATVPRILISRPFSPCLKNCCRSPRPRPLVQNRCYRLRTSCCLFRNPVAIFALEDATVASSQASLFSSPCLENFCVRLVSRHRCYRCYRKTSCCLFKTPVVTSSFEGRHCPNNPCSPLLKIVLALSEELPPFASL